MREYDAVAHLAIMTDMARSHEHAIIANSRYGTPIRRANVHGHMLPDQVSIADHQLGWLAAITRVMRRAAQIGKITHRAVRTDLRMPLNDHMGQYLGSRANLRVRSDD